MTYKEESYVLDNIKQITKEIHENNIMLQRICSYINSVLNTREHDEQNAFEQNVFANIVSELFDGTKNRFKGNNLKNK